jgi:type IV secretory pathway VirB6-like protein
VLASSFGFIALGVGTLFGPLLIPWILVPQVRHYFYGWINFSLKFAMYAVVAAAQAFIWATATDKFVMTAIAGDFSLKHLLNSLVGLGILTLGSVLGLLSTGSLVNDLFSGSAHGGGGIGVLAAIKGLF